MLTFIEIVESLWNSVLSQLPTILLALVVLFVGWVIARYVSKVLGRLVYALTDHSQVQELVEEQERYRVDKVVARVSFYVLMVFVLGQFFDILGVSVVRGPLVSVANEFALAVPNLIKAVLILLSAWVLATLLRGLAVRALAAKAVSRTLERMEVVEDDSGRSALIKTAGNVVYYLVLIMFLPAVFGALRLEGLQGPFEQVIAQALGFLPKLVAASITVLLGYFAARIVRGLFTQFLANVGVDRLPERVGMGQVFESVPLSRSLGTIAFILVLLPITISALESLGVEAISGPAISMLTIVLNMVPSVAIALVIFAAGVVLARWVGNLTTTILESINLAGFLVRWGLLRSDNTASVVHSVLGKVVTGIAVLLVLIEVFDVLHMTELSSILGGILAYLPHVVIAVAILAVGYAVSQFAHRSLRSVLEHTSYPVWLASVARYAIAVLTVMMALEQLGVAPAIVVNAFSILLGSLALAAAIALGLGGKEPAQRWLEKNLPIQSRDRSSDDTDEDATA